MEQLERSTPPLALLQSAIDKGIMPDQLGKLLDLQERWERNQAAKEFAEAITGFQKDMTKHPITKDKEVRGRAQQGEKGPLLYTFADFADIMAIVQPIAARYGIVITFDSLTAQGALQVICRIRVGTHVESTSFSLPMPVIPNANAAQIAGAALSYAKRYALCAALNIQVKGEDVDGAGIQDGITPEQVKIINELFEECREAGNEVNKPKFFAWLGCTDLNDMPAKDFEKATWELMRKRKAAKK